MLQRPDEDRPLTTEEVVALWRDDKEFGTYFSHLIADSDFESLRWETPATTSATLGRPFEFVLVDSPGLARNVDAHCFAQHFSDSASVVRFTNLRGDAELVVPCPITHHAVYRHLASFLREAPDSQCQQLWRAVGQAMTDRVSDVPVWLSTAGAGVSWLHVRLDSRPKYYSYKPYK